MNSDQFNRALGTFPATAFAKDYTHRLLHSIQPARDVKFDSSSAKHTDAARDEATTGQGPWAHRAGVNSVVVDRFEGRLLLSGGADGSIHLWDLSQPLSSTNLNTYHVSNSLPESFRPRKFGVTHISFYAFDAAAFLTSSYDHNLKIYDTSTLVPSATFNLDAVVYSHAISPIASHLLVACATQDSSVRLVDLKSGALTQALVGHERPVLSVAWSPRDEYQLASAGVDGTVRIWDVRRARGSIGLLDFTDDVGNSEFSRGSKAGSLGKAHNGAANGVVWTEDARHIVTAGHDEKIRVWDMKTGANTLTTFGPLIKNNHLSALLPLLVPSDLALSGKEVMYWPNPAEIYGFELFDGKMIKRMKVSGISHSARNSAAKQMNLHSRTTALTWKFGDVGMFSAHTDGTVRAWLPRTEEDIEGDEEEEAERRHNDPEEISKKRKRDALDDVYKSLTKQPITFI